jgi:phage repressor protein C with HTH and peptisase S24 domain
MGKDGDLIHDHPPFLFTKNFLIRKKVTFRMNLFFLTAIDSSMSPRIDEYGVVMFDIGQKEIISQEIYVVRMNGDQRLRRIVKMLGGDINVRCDNPVYGDQIIPKDKEESLEIVGRVLWVADPMEW